MDNENLIDMTQISNLKSLFNDGFEPFLLSFYEDFEAKEKELIAAIKNNKMDEVSKITHTLKGNSLNLGALGLVELCIKIEAGSKSGDMGEVSAAQRELSAMYPIIKAEFNRISSIH